MSSPSGRTSAGCARSWRRSRDSHAPADPALDVADGLPGPLERRQDRPRRLGEQRGVRSGDLAVGDDASERVPTDPLGGGLGGDDDGGAAIGDLRGVAGGDVARLVERRPEPAERLERRLTAHALVDAERHGVALALRDAHLDDLVVEEPVLLGLGRPLVAVGGELVLLEDQDRSRWDAVRIEEGRALFKSRVAPELYARGFYDRAIIDILVRTKGHVASKMW